MSPLIDMVYIDEKTKLAPKIGRLPSLIKALCTVPDTEDCLRCLLQIFRKISILIEQGDGIVHYDLFTLVYAMDLVYATKAFPYVHVSNNYAFEVATYQEYDHGHAH